MSESKADRFFQTLREATSGREGEYESFTALLNQGDADTVQLLIENVDESDYSLADWVEALLAFETWLEGQGESRRLVSKMVGYVHCCMMISSPVLPSPSLKVILIETLTEYGFAALTDPHI